MNYLIKIDDIYDKLEFYKKKIGNINNIIDEMDKISREIEWEGEAYSSFMNSYLVYIDGLKEYRDGLIHYSKILASFYSKYDNYYDEMEKKFQESLREMEEENEYNIL